MIFLSSTRMAISLAFFCVGLSNVFSNPDLLNCLPENGMPGLNRILEKTVTNSDEVALREFVEVGSWGTLEVGKSLLGPNLDAYIAYRGEDEVQDIGAEWESRTIADISLVKPLFHWGVLSADLKIRKISYNAVQNESNLVIRNLSKSVRSQSLNLALRYIELEQLRDSYELQKGKAILERQRYESGLVADDRIEIIELQLTQREIQLSNRDMDVRFATEDLADKIGLEVAELVASLPKYISKPEYLSDEEVDRLELRVDDALAANEALQNLASSLEIDKFRANMVEKRRWPKLNLSTGITQNERDVDGRIREEQLFYAGVSVNWNLFDGRETKGLKATAMSQVLQTEVRYKNLKEAVSRNYKRSVMRLRNSLKQLKIEEIYLERSKEEFERAKQNHDLDKMSDNDLKASRDRLLSKEIQTQKARAGYFNSLVSLISELGLDPYVKMYKESKDASSLN